MPRKLNKSGSQSTPENAIIDAAERLRIATGRLREIAARGYISDEPTVDPLELSVADRLELLDQLLPTGGTVRASEHVRRLFPELSQAESKETIPPLPSQAPILWADRNPGEMPPEFVRRVYGPWIGGGLSKPNIGRLDPPLYRAILNWSRNHVWPENLPLPTLRERNDQALRQLQTGEFAAALRHLKPGQEAREVRRLAGLLERRANHRNT
ncbi:hypothetical protein AMEJIAPC_03768 [Caulobacter sp. NIBR1757]|nr:hypothetical protein AMEJIAPC_03768 [Caulobacter sp. NIBR1757]